jgi:hypothetical protein
MSRYYLGNIVIPKLDDYQVRLMIASPGNEINGLPLEFIKEGTWHAYLEIGDEDCIVLEHETYHQGEAPNFQSGTIDESEKNVGLFGLDRYRDYTSAMTPSPQCMQSFSEWSNPYWLKIHNQKVGIFAADSYLDKWEFIHMKNEEDDHKLLHFYVDLFVGLFENGLGYSTGPLAKQCWVYTFTSSQEANATKIKIKLKSV